MQIASRWLRECVHNHKACNRDIPASPWYPTRLLHLGPLDDHDDYIRLVHATQNPPSGPYATLSHRWGDANFIQLTRSLMPKLSAKSSMTDLPKTFREAVFVARRLNVSYLWIDSLCIIQDSSDTSDWASEVATMQGCIHSLTLQHISHGCNRQLGRLVPISLPSNCSGCTCPPVCERSASLG